MPRFTSDNGAGTKFESDADVLKFPEGGVYGRRDGSDAPELHLEGDGDGETIDPIAEVERRFALVQAHLDELADELEESFPFGPASGDDDDWHPSAA